MDRLLEFQTGKWTAPITLLFGALIALISFGPLAVEKSSVFPTSGLPATAESVQAETIRKSLPQADGTLALVIYRSAEAFTDEQLSWIMGAIDPATKTTSGGVNEKFLEFSNLEVQGRVVVPPAQISNDGKAALVSVQMDAESDFNEVAKRVDEIREIAAEDLPANPAVAVTGPDAFTKDLGSIFEGANDVLVTTTAIVVALLLLITYRSPFLWVVPLIVVGVADGVGGILARQVAIGFGYTPDSSVVGILSVLVFGAGTNYALLLISRYREELLQYEDRRLAMRKAVRGAGPAVLASGSTVALAVSLLLLAEIEGRQVLGLVAAVGILVAMFAALVILPAALVIFPRTIFWPLIPKQGGQNPLEKSIWGKLGTFVSNRPVVISSVGILLLGVLASGGLGLKTGLSATEVFIEKPEAVVGQEFLAESFSAGAANPTQVIVESEQIESAIQLISSVEGVSEIKVVGGTAEYTQIDAVLSAEPESQDAYETVRELRTVLDELDPGAVALVGGQDATSLDSSDATARDQALLVPLILLSVFLILILLLRSLLAPILLLLAVVTSFFSAFGASWFLFQYVFGFPAIELSVFLIAFLFLVALGVDYSIFLVTRAQEEAEIFGTREGMRRALGATGGVITSAGILLAVVFSVLGVLPLVSLAQIGVIVCLGVLLDTLLVRTVLVPAMAFKLGAKFWWPKRNLAD